MELSVATRLPAQPKTSMLVVAVYRKGELSPTAKQLDDETSGALSAVIESGDMTGDTGASAVLRNVSGSRYPRILLMGAGEQSKPCTDEQFRKIVDAAVKAVSSTAAAVAVSALTEIEVKERDIEWKARHEGLGVTYNAYRFDQFRSKGKPKAAKLKKWQSLQTDKLAQKSARQGLKQALAINDGVETARTLGNLPGNVCTPVYLAEQAKKLKALSPNVKVSVLNEAQMQKLGMNSLLSVSRGSRQEARLICVEYRGAPASSKPIVLVGKGITFDTGGISIKPSAAMDEMKYDMCGAAGVFGTMQSVVSMKLKCNLVMVIAAAENMPDGDASRPGDIVETLSGQTVEILNTDAEGRLVLCDALTWVGNKYKPAAVIDVATLTGACIIALGHICSAVMANDQSLADELLAAGTVSGDKTWQLPLWDEYQSQLKSNFADMANIGGRAAGTITAGCFLSRFSEDFRWAHLDIAGVAWKSGGQKGATGRPVPLLTQYIMDQCG